MSRTRIALVVAAALGAAGGWTLVRDRFARRVPPAHLVLISIDTLRADHLGTYGYERDTTPEIDALARRGTVFEQAVAQAPNTPPSMASLLTSLYPSVHGFTGYERHLPAHRTTLAEALRERGFATWAFVDGGYLRATFGFDQGFDHFDDRRLGAAAIVGNVLDWLDTHTARRFFLFVHCYDVHSPYLPPPPLDALFADPAYAGGFVPTTENLKDVDAGRRTLAADDLRQVIALYDGGIRHADRQVGRLVQGLARRGLLESAMLVVTADHGEEFLEHGRMLHQQTYYLPNLHVPLIFLVPGERPRRIGGPVELLDVMPTALDLLGLPPHSEAMGRSLAALIRGGETPGRLAFAEPVHRGDPWRTVVSDRHQLRYNVRSGRARLFDLRSDPEATTDVSRREAEETKRLVAALRERRRLVSQARQADDGPAEPARALDDETRRQLEAMGYLDP